MYSTVIFTKTSPMKFGKVDHPESIDFTLPKDHSGTKEILSKQKKAKKPNLYVGCAKWNKEDLKGFYPILKKHHLCFRHILLKKQMNGLELIFTFRNLHNPNTLY